MSNKIIDRTARKATKDLMRCAETAVEVNAAFEAREKLRVREQEQKQ